MDLTSFIHSTLPMRLLSPSSSLWISGVTTLESEAASEDSAADSSSTSSRGDRPSSNAWSVTSRLQTEFTVPIRAAPSRWAS